MKLLAAADAPPFPGSLEFDARVLFEGDSFGMVHFTLKPGEYIPLHNMPFEVCFLVLSGRGTLTVNDENHEVREGFRIHCLPEARRGWRNHSVGEDLRILVLKIKKDTENSGEQVDIRPMDGEKPAPNPHGVDVRRVYESDFALMSILTLKPGEQLIRHITPVDVFFYILSGTGVVEVGDDTEEVTADTMIESPRGIPHCWYNRSDGLVRVLVVKTPKPTTPTVLL